MAFPVSRVCIGRLAPQNGAGAALGGNGRATGGPRDPPPCFGHELLGGYLDPRTAAAPATSISGGELELRLSVQAVFSIQ